MPLISVIIPTYNRKHKLKRAIESVLNQTFTDFELIVVDNASTDGTLDLIKNVNDLRIKYLRHEINKGGPAARNTGIMNARASWISFLDDDDQWFPLKLEKEFTKTKEISSRIGLIYSCAEIYDEREQKRIFLNPTIYKGNVYKRILLGTILASCSALIKKSCFDKVGLFDESLSSCQDWDMWLRIAHDYEFDFVPDLLARVNLHGEQISSDYKKLIPGREAMVKKHTEEFKKYPAIYCIHLKRIGKLYCLNGLWRKGFSWFNKVLAINPLEIFKIAAWLIWDWPQVYFFGKSRLFNKLQ